MGNWLFPRGNPNTNPPATRLRVQTSVQGVVRPIVWGQTRIAGNLVDYQDFRSFQTASGGGGGKGGSTGFGGKGGSTQTNYAVTAVIGICEGPILNIPGYWSDKQFFTTTGTDWAVFFGGYAQTAWSYMVTAHPGNALNYRGLAYAAKNNWLLQTSPEIPQINWEVVSSVAFAYGGTAAPSTPPDIIRNFYGSNYPPIRQGSTPTNATTPIPDANPRDVIVDFLTNVNYGVGWPSNRLDSSMTLYSSACLALGLVISPALTEQKDGNAFLQEIADATHSTFRWTNGVLSVVPWYDTAITSGTSSNVTETHVIPNNPTNGIQVGTGNFLANVSVVDSGTSVAYTQVAYTPATGMQAGTNHYMVSPSGFYQFATADIGRSVNITYSAAAQASYQPYNTPIYDINLDLLPNQGSSGAASGEQPIQVVRKPSYYSYNSVKLEWLDRNNNYDPSIIELKDQAAIDAFGLRARDVKQTHMFCVGASATISATLQLIREKIPNTYTFTLGPQYILLEVEDIVTLTRPVMGLNAQPVRIMEIQENADQTLTITAEEYMGTVSAPLYSSQLPSGIVNNYNADPGSINPPIIFEPPAALAAAAGSEFVIVAGVSGVNSVWGGCEVWASIDGNNYGHYGTIRGGSRMGVTTATLPAVTANPVPGDQTIDTTNTLAVDLTESRGQLESGGALDLESATTICWVGNGPGNSTQGEVVAYQTATLTATNKYNLTTLARGEFQSASSIVSHPSGSPFLRITAAEIFYHTYNPNLVGQTVYFKFQSFNQWGGGLQNLASVGAVAYTIQGQPYATPLPQVQNLRAFFEAGYEKLYWDEVADFRSGIMYEIRKGATWDTALQIGLVAHPPFVIFGGNDTYWVEARVVIPSGQTIYSTFPSDVVIGGNTLIPFIFKTINEQDVSGTASWPGTINNSTAVTWNPALDSTGVAYSNNFLTVNNPSTSSTRSDYAFVTCFNSLGLPNFPWYWEVRVNSLGTAGSSIGQTVGIGMASTSFQATPSSELGADLANASVGLYAGGTVFYGGTSVARIQGFSTGDIIGVAYNSNNAVSSGLIWFRTNGGFWNNSSLNDPNAGTGGIPVSGLSTNLSGSFFPAPAANIRRSTGAKVTAAFSSASWSFTIPGSTFAPVFIPSLMKSGTFPNQVLVSAVGSTNGIYETNQIDIPDLGYIPANGIFMNVSYTGTGSPIGQNILTIADILSQPSILGSSWASQLVDVHPEIATASTLSSLGTLAWSPWQKFVPGIYSCMAAKTRMIVDSLAPYQVQAYCLGMVWSAQVNLRLDHYVDTTPFSGFSTITFHLDSTTTPAPFNSDPNGSTANPYYTYTIVGGQPGDVVGGFINLSGVTYQVTNAGSTVQRQLDWTIEGI